MTRAGYTPQELRGAAVRFREALRPGFIAWYDGRQLSPEDTLTQIERGLLAATTGGRGVQQDRDA